jgi:C-terminal processing protease CtpA/Prc
MDTSEAFFPHTKRRRLAALLRLLCAALALTACSTNIPLPVGDAAPTDTPDAPAANQPIALAGTLSYTNKLATSYHARAAVALVDLHGFVARDHDWRIPADSLIFGRLRLDTDHQTGSYYLHLPEQPPGELHDVDHNGQANQGVKIFAVAYWDDPFSSRDRFTYGWPTDLTSTIADTENHDEITGGKLVAWAPDGAEQFPSGFGDDNRLFTDDDPLQPLPAGYSVIDLSGSPFAIDRSDTPNLKLYEETHYAVKKFANLSYTQALNRLFEQLRRDYAFNGIAGKQPDWDTLYKQLAPRVTKAEQDHDPELFYEAMRDLANAFHDGHVSLDGGDRDDDYFRATSGGGYGFAVRETGDEHYVVVFVQPDGPAARAGIAKGAELISFDGQPIGAALESVKPMNGPFSTDLALRYDQLRYLLRAKIGASAQITFANPGQPDRSVTLTAVDERDSLHATSLRHDADPTAPPIEYWILDSGLGYVRVNTNDDDFDLTDELFARALDSFDYHEVPGVIVDLRQNDGGALLGFAGYLTDRTIDLAQLEYYSPADRAFEPDGPPQTIEPLKDPYHFGKLAVLVDQGCYSACELEAYGLSQVPGAIVVGQYPTAGVVAEVSQGQFDLPGDLQLQVPTGRYVLPDGQLFLEGKGVAPTLRVPLDRQNLLAGDDVVLRAAEQALLK